MKTHSSLGFGIVCLRSVILLVLIYNVTGCAAEYRISVPDSDDTGMQPQEVRMDAYLWGTNMSPQVVWPKCEGVGINDVTVVDHLGYDLIGVISLGIWKPITVRYRCKAPGATKPAVLFPDGTNESKVE